MMNIVAITNDTFAVCIGNEEVRVWSRFEKPAESQDQAARQVWQVVAALNYRDLKIKQLVANVKLRLSNLNSSSRGERQSADSAPNLALLHEDGWVSFWTQNSW